MADPQPADPQVPAQIPDQPTIIETRGGKAATGAPPTDTAFILQPPSDPATMPLYRLGGPARSTGFFNYVIALRTAAPQGDVRATDGGMALVRIGDRCSPDPAFDNRL